MLGVFEAVVFMLLKLMELGAADVNAKMRSERRQYRYCLKRFSMRNLIQSSIYRKGLIMTRGV